MARYDLQLFLKGIVSKKANIKNVRILCRGAFAYYSVKFRNLSFIDSLAFMSASLSELVDLRCKNVPLDNLADVIPHTVKYVTDNYAPCMVKYVYRKQIYPYSLSKSLSEMLAITSYPTKDDFYDTLNCQGISDSDYSFGMEVWCQLERLCHLQNKQMSLYHLHSWYLDLDCFLLSDMWSWYSRAIFSDFSIFPANFLTANSLAWFLARRMSETNLELIHDYQIYTDFENSIRGGYCGVSKRYTRANNVELPDYNPNLDDIFISMVDYNSLYGEMMTGRLPFANIEYVDPTTFTSDYIMNGVEVGESADTGYLLIVDIRIPNFLKYFYDDLPIMLHTTEKISPGPHTSSISTHCSQKKLIASWYDMDFYAIDIELLKFMLTVGCTIESVHRVISYSQKSIFKKYIEHCVKRRNESKHIPVLNRLYKLLSNSVFGKSIQNDRNFNKIHTLVHVSNLNRHIASPRFSKVRRVSKDCFCVIMTKNYVKLTSPIYIGSTILQKAKLKMYKFHYYIAKVSGATFPERYLINQDEWIMKLIHLKNIYIFKQLSVYKWNLFNIHK